MNKLILHVENLETNNFFVKTLKLYITKNKTIKLRVNFYRVITKTLYYFNNLITL